MKTHLRGGTLWTVMVAEVKRSMVEHQGNITHTAIALGITPRTLRLWKVLPDFTAKGAVDKIMKLAKKKVSKKSKVKKIKPKNEVAPAA